MFGQCNIPHRTLFRSLDHLEQERAEALQKQEELRIAREKQAAAEKLALQKHREEERIAREKKQALNDAKNEISALAVEIAGKVVGASLDTAQQEKLVDSFLEELGEQV
jgi:F-type H+-transporting ATPase subunit b